MRNLRAIAIKAISTTVRTCTMLCRRSSTPSRVWLNSSAISTVMIMPKIAWNTAGSAGSTTPSTSSPTTRISSVQSATSTTPATTRVRAKQITCSKRS